MYIYRIIDTASPFRITFEFENCRIPSSLHFRTKFTSIFQLQAFWDPKSHQVASEGLKYPRSTLHIPQEQCASND